MQRPDGEDAVPLEHRHALYQQAKAKRPERCSGEIRDWEPVGDVMLNPDRAEEAALYLFNGAGEREPVATGSSERNAGAISAIEEHNAPDDKGGALE